jgi:hypothetical protein
VTAVVWYLVRYEGLSFDQALERIRAKRRVANPNVRFEVPLRLASGEEIEEDWLERRILDFCERMRADYGDEIDPQRVRRDLERQGTLPAA